MYNRDLLSSIAKINEKKKSKKKTTMVDWIGCFSFLDEEESPPESCGGEKTGREKLEHCGCL